MRHARRTSPPARILHLASIFRISSITLYVRLSRRWVCFCQSLTEIDISVQQLDEEGREVKLRMHICGGNYVSFRYVDFRKWIQPKRPETDEKGDCSDLGSMGANEKACRGDKQQSSRSRYVATVLHARRSLKSACGHRMSNLPEARSQSSNPFVL